jgi:hypothetical protein
MKNLVVLIAGCLMALSASAQNMNIEQKAQEVARDVQRFGRSLTYAERAEVAGNLDSISRILRGGNSGFGGGNSNSATEYTCVAKITMVCDLLSSLFALALTCKKQP